MIYVGVDIGKSRHCAGAIDAQGRCVLKPWAFSQTPVELERLEEKLHKLGASEEVKIGMEATGHYWKVLFTWLTSRQWCVEVLNPVLTAASARTHLRGRKTDADDTLVIAKAVRDGGYTPLRMAAPEMEQLKGLCRQRGFVVKESANAKRRLRSLLDCLFPEFSGLFSDPYGKTALAVLEAFPSARQLASVHLRRLTSLIEKASHHCFGAKKARALREAARDSTARHMEQPGEEYALQMMIAQLRFFEQQISALEVEIAKLFASLEHPIKSIPGIGPTLAPVILSEYGDLTRFQGRRTAHRLLAYAGTDPRVRQSGQWQGRMKMSKRGSPILRTALYQAARLVCMHCPEFQSIYDKHRIERHKHHGVALSHVVRKLLHVIYAISRDNVPFDPAKMVSNSA
jgi:transposase